VKRKPDPWKYWVESLVAKIGTTTHAERALGVATGSVSHWRAGRYGASRSMKGRILAALKCAKRLEAS
jgi:hypothetical protein